MKIYNRLYFLDIYPIHAFHLPPEPWFPLQAVVPQTVLLQFLLRCLSYSSAHNSIVLVTHTFIVFLSVDRLQHLPLLLQPPAWVQTGLTRPV